MKKIYYSANKRGFYQSDIHNKDQIPSDAKEISQSFYNEVFAKQAQGEEIVPDEKGLPTTRKIIPSYDKVLEGKLFALKKSLHKYLEDQGYDLGSQITLQAIQMSSKSTASTKRACEDIFDWINDTVLDYYEQKKNELKNSQNPIEVKWDFSVCNNTKSLRKFYEVRKMR